MRFKTSILLILLGFLLSCSETIQEAQPENKVQEKQKQEEQLVVPKPAFDGPSFEFKILHMNDVYEIAPSKAKNLGGLARVATLRKQLLAENEHLLTVLPGDFLSPSFIGLQKDEKDEAIAGKHMVEVLNAVGLDYVTFGNHEFDLSYEQLKACIDMSEFAWVSCNTFHQIPMGVTYFTKKINGKESNIGRYVVHRFNTEAFGELKLGITGVTLPFNLKDWVNYSTVFLALKTTYEEFYPLVDMTVLLTHLEIESDKELARRLPIFPLFMGGHDHQNMLEKVGNTTIAKADANAHSVYVHTLNYYPQTRAVRVESELIRIDSTIAEDPEVKVLVDKWQRFAEKMSARSNYNPYEVIYNADTAIDCREITVRNQAAAIGWLIGESFLNAFPDADCAILNGGSIRLDDYLTGEVMQQDVLALLPFGGPVSVVEMKGKDLQKTLDIGMYMNIGKGGFLQVSNILKSGQFWMIDGEKLDYERTYKVVMPKFLADGRESNLEYLKNLKAISPKLSPSGQVKNDVRDLMIHFLKSKDA